MISPLVVLLLSSAHAADTFGGYSFYLGDIHAHSGVSRDAGSSDLAGTCKSGDCGAFEDLYEVARDNGLDFAAVPDHVNGGRGGTTAGFDRLIDLTLAEDDPAGGFITIPAAEVWFMMGSHELGHKTLLMFGDDTTLAGLTATDMQPVGTLSPDVVTCGAIHTWATNLEASYGNLLLVPHHPAATHPMPTDWSCYDDTYEPVVEVYSEHGNSLGDGTGYDTMWSHEYSGSAVHDAIDPDTDALRMGFVGGSDKHNSRPGDVCEQDTEMPNHPYGGGLTIVVADESESFSRDLLYDAFMAHHTETTTGPLVPVTISFESGGAALGTLGDDLGLPTDQDLDVTVAVPESLAAYVNGVELVTPDGRFAMDSDEAGNFTLTLDADDATGYVYAAVEIDGASWYGAAGCDDGGDDDLEYVWTSPSYIDTVAGDLDADGQTVADGDCDDGDDTVYLTADEVMDDGIDQDCDGADYTTADMIAAEKAEELAVDVARATDAEREAEEAAAAAAVTTLPVEESESSPATESTEEASTAEASGSEETALVVDIEGDPVEAVDADQAATSDTEESSVSSEPAAEDECVAAPASEDSSTAVADSGSGEAIAAESTEPDSSVDTETGAEPATSESTPDVESTAAETGSAGEASGDAESTESTAPTGEAECSTTDTPEPTATERPGAVGSAAAEAGTSAGRTSTTSRVWRDDVYAHGAPRSPHRGGKRHRH